MRVAVLSDIHADLSALNDVLAAIDNANPDELWCLGDIVGLGGAEPAEVVELVRERCALTLGGNHDAWVTGSLSLDMLPLPRQRAELLWQRARLSSEQLDWLSSLQPHAERAGAQLWHGSAGDPLTGWVASPSQAAEHLDRQRSDLGLVGHTHRSAVGSLRDGLVRWRPRPRARVELATNARWLLNPGAVAGARSCLEIDLEADVATWYPS